MITATERKSRLASFLIKSLCTFLIALPLSFPALARAAERGTASRELDTTLRRIFSSQDFKVKNYGPIQWLEGGKAYTTLETSSLAKGARDIVRYDASTGKRSVLVPRSKLIPPGQQAPLQIEDYAWSQDTSRLLIFTNAVRVWRLKTRGDYWVLDLKSGKLQKLGGDVEPSTLMFATFSPDGTRVAYVHDKDLFVQDLETGRITRLTTRTSDSIINGTSDWVNEEELFIRNGFKWSPDGRSIAYWQFDTSGVKDFPLMYNTGGQHDVVTHIPYPEYGVYPTIQHIPYPQPGTTNSAVRVGVVSAEGGPTRWMKVPGDPRNTYIARMDWADDSNELVLEHLNRLQNTNDVLLANAETGDVRKIFTDQDKAWVDFVPDLRWIDAGKNLLWLSERDGWRHAYAIPRNGGEPRLITHGNFDVVTIEQVDSEWLYYIASPENATERYLYRTRLDGTGNPERLTPKDQKGTNGYQISPDAHWAIHTYSTFDTPPVTDLVSLPGHKVERVLETNAALRKNIDGIRPGRTEFFRVPVVDGVSLDAWMIKPRNFDPTKKYPLLIYVYGEPAGQTVLNDWQSKLTLFHFAIADAGYLVASVDNRGTPAPRGRDWRKVVYGAVGVLSSKEQASALTELEKTRPYIDASRVAVWGKSGGGTNTLNLMFRHPELYKVGMSVAPVPDQRLYDTIYQERYMGLPQDNVMGYEESSAINFAGGLQGHLLIMHGSGDDNVHYQGTELLLNRLIELGKLFDFMEYPNRTHSLIEGKGTDFHVHATVARYLLEHLQPGPSGGI